MNPAPAPFLRAYRLSTISILLFPIWGTAVSARLHAQEEVVAHLEGQVLLEESPLPEGRVVLHMVGPEEGGAIDSVQVGPDGRFRISLPHVPDPENRSEVFFASMRYHGILYFGQPISRAVQLDSLYQIYVFDTLSAPEGGAMLPISMRNLFLESVDGGWTVTDLFQIRNEDRRTLFAQEEAVVWTYPLPPDLTDFQVGQGDLSPGAMTYADGSIQVSSPIPPGERVFVIQYHLPEASTSFPTPGATDLLEILVKEPAPPLEIGRLQPLQPVELEPGTTYRRFTGTDLSGGEVEVTLGQESGGLSAAWLAVVLALFLGAAGLFAFQRRAPVAPREPEADSAPPSDSGSREALIEEIAHLDEVFLARSSPTSDETRSYEREREALMDRLTGLG